MKNKKTYSAEERAIILREHLEDNISISDLAEKYNIEPSTLYNWKKLLFEQAPQTLTRKSKKEEKRISADAKRIAELEGLLSKREKLISELVQENIDLKKNIDGESLKMNGLNRKFGMK